jgi:uncharacterized membrane protein (UPF0127 family)
MRALVAALLLLLSLQLAWCEEEEVKPVVSKPAPGLGLPVAGEEDGKTLQLRVGNRRISAEIASTPLSREQGLMQRPSLCENCGMLFVFERADKHRFWMKDTLLPLTIAFIGADGDIINIENMEPFSLDTYEAREDALYALEVNRGWFDRNSLGKGIKVRRSDSRAR